MFSITTICPELPQYRRYHVTIKGKSKKLFFEHLNRKFDKYILFAISMKDYIPKGKPCMVLEGFAPDLVLKPTRNKKNIAMYAGGLAKDNGIKLIIEAANCSKYLDELWICGVGECLEYVKNNTSQKILYFGQMKNSEIRKLENEATVLLNIRDPHDPLTEFSFPSKIFEYMASGTIVLSTELKGISKEYYDRMIIVKKYSANEIAEKMDEVFMMNYSEYLGKVEEAESFVKEKTASKRMLSIIEFVCS